jgi:hypothetical protein
VNTDSLSIARWQFRMAWGLADNHYLDRLTDQTCLGLPDPDSWTVRATADGRWVADWTEPEPADPRPPSVGWLTWHILWWWCDALAVVRGDRPGLRADVFWPGTAKGVVTELRRLASEWDAATQNLDRQALNRPAAFPWSEERPLISLIAWVPVELMKNVAEIGMIVNMRDAQSV